MTKDIRTRSGPGARRRAQTVLAASLLALSGAAFAQAVTGPVGVVGDGYVTAAGMPVVNGAGQCWVTGAWDIGDAAAPCHVVARVAAAPVPVVRAAPEPAPAPAPAPIAVVPVQPAPVLQRITLSTDVLFRFDSAELRESALAELDKLAETVKGAEVDRVQLLGHADPIGSERYNQALSEARAQTVKEYLVSKGVEPQRIEVKGLGESQLVTDCSKQLQGWKLISCFAPNRRVEVEILGHREVAAGEVPSTTGAGSSGATGSSMNPSSR